jgi:hypothetical protein
MFTSGPGPGRAGKRGCRRVFMRGVGCGWSDFRLPYPGQIALELDIFSAHAPCTGSYWVSCLGGGDRGVRWAERPELEHHQVRSASESGREHRRCAGGDPLPCNPSPYDDIHHGPLYRNCWKTSSPTCLHLRESACPYPEITSLFWLLDGIRPPYAQTPPEPYPLFRNTASTSALGRSLPLTRIRQRCVRTETGTSGAKSSAASVSVK